MASNNSNSDNNESNDSLKHDDSTQFWTSNNQRGLSHSFSEYDDDDVTEDDIKLYADQYVGSVDFDDEESLNAALAAMNLDTHQIGTGRIGEGEGGTDFLTRTGGGVLGSQEGSLEGSQIFASSSEQIESLEPDSSLSTYFNNPPPHINYDIFSDIVPLPNKEHHEPILENRHGDKELPRISDTPLRKASLIPGPETPADQLPKTPTSPVTASQLPVPQITLSQIPTPHFPTSLLPAPQVPTSPDRIPDIFSPSTPINKPTDRSLLPAPDPTDLSDFYAAFSKQLSLNDNKEQVVDEKNKILILLSPLSYKHVFSRNWVNKKYIDSIVERPQRLMAASLGIGSAIAKSPSKFKIEISDKRTNLINAPHVAKIHGSNWANRLYKLCAESSEKLAQGNLEVPEYWNEGDIYLTSETIDALEGVVAVSEKAVDRLFSNEDDSAASNKIFVSIRPPGHHSHPCVPSGFCLINNVQIAIQYARDHYDITHAVILDFDLHHGDGSQDICWKLAGFDEGNDDNIDDDDDESDHVIKLEEDSTTTKIKLEDTVELRPPSPPPPSTTAPSTPSKSDDTNTSPTKSSPRKRGVKKNLTPASTQPAPPPPPLALGYFSIHDINSFPTELGYATAENIKNASVCLMAHGMCIWNIHLEPYNDEAHFDRIYNEKYQVLFEKAQQFLRNGQLSAIKNKRPFKPLIVMSAGFDSSEHEHLSMQRHQVSVPTSFFNRFTNDSVKLANEFANGKIISMLEGGYSDAALGTGIFSHLTGLAEEKWDSKWCNPAVIKQINKACKLKWKPSSSSGSVSIASEPEWLNRGIELGRSLWPHEIKLQVASAMNPGPSTTGRRVRKSDEDQSVLATPLRVLRDSTIRRAGVMRSL